MNKTIKYRAYNKINGMMDVVGFEQNMTYVHARYNYDFDGYSVFEGYINARSMKDGSKKSCVVVESIDLKDKNGKEIYTGDIIRVSYRGVESDVGYVGFDKVTLRYSLMINDCYYGLTGINKLEIIGNVYENLELLKGDIKQ